MSSVEDVHNDVSVLALVPALHMSASSLATLMNRGFKGYFVPVEFTPAAMASWLASVQVDLGRSFVLRRGDEDLGLMLTTIRGEVARLGTMGVVPEARGKGYGRQAMVQYLNELRGVVQRIVLEVIDINDAGVALYEGSGFVRGRHLSGYAGMYSGIDAPPPRGAVLERVDAEFVRDKMLRAQDGGQISWPMDGRCLATNMPSFVCYQFGPSCCMINEPRDGNALIRCVVTDTKQQGLGWGTSMMAAVMREYDADVTWKIPEIVPDDFSSGWITRLGLAKTDMGQWEMACEGW